MKKLLAILLIAFSSAASAAPAAGDVQILQYINSFQNLEYLINYANGSCLFYLDASVTQPRCVTVGTGLTVNSGVLSANAPALSLTTTGTSGASTYNSSTGVLNVPNYATNAGTVTSITAGSGLSGGTITTSGTINMPNVGTAGTYSGVTTDAQGRVSSGTNRSYNYQTRSLNTCFQISSTRDAFVTYSVDIATSLSLTTGQQGTVYLRTYTNSSCTTGQQEITRFVNGQTGTLTIGLALTQNVTATLTGVIPSGVWIQLVTENNTGTPTFTARPGQEVLL